MDTEVRAGTRVVGREVARSVESALANIPVSAAMSTRFVALTPEHPARHAIELSLMGRQADFPVVEDGRPVGLITRADVLWVTAADRVDAPVGVLMRVDYGVVAPDDTLALAATRLQSTGMPVMVVDRGRLVGLLTSDSLAEVLTAGCARAFASRLRTAK
jgi:CBS domain-containing protein